jgi:TRAP-type C4-dicarboxylate transport system permease small subunit
VNKVRTAILLLCTAGAALLTFVGGYAYATGVDTVTTHTETINSGWPGIFAVMLGVLLLVVLAVVAWDEFGD